ncbi:MAG: carbonic anhydrase, partial [bacterium]
GAHWGYSGHGGPEHWGELDAQYEMCAKGKNQSPINLTGFIEAELEPLQLSYSGGATEILNNGHSIQVNYAPGSILTVDGKSFVLKQFHFHAPSENQIDGRTYPMEVHLVHADKDGNLAVIGIMMDLGEANPIISELWKKMPEKEGDTFPLASGLDAKGLLPKSKDYYRYDGSLTTPPCTEGVRWIVMKEPVSVSREQAESFEHIMHHPNNRPVQPLNARIVAK